MDPYVFRPYLEEVLRNHGVSYYEMGALLIRNRFVDDGMNLREAVESVLYFLPEERRLEIYREVNARLL